MQDRQRYLATQINIFGVIMKEGYRNEFINNQRFIETALVQLYFYLGLLFEACYYCLINLKLWL